MKNSHKGKVDVSALRYPPEKHEYETAKFFADRGLVVTFIRPTNIEGQNNPDFEMSGKIWETKSLTTNEVATVKRRLNSAAKQSPHIIMDLRRVKPGYENELIKALIRKSKSPNIKTLVIIKRDNNLLTLKGRFDIM